MDPLRSFLGALSRRRRRRFPSNGGNSIHHRAIEIGSLVDGGADVEDAVESAGRALDLGGDEGVPTESLTELGQLLRRKRTDPTRTSLMQETPEVSLEMKSGRGIFRSR